VGDMFPRCIPTLLNQQVQAIRAYDGRCALWDEERKRDLPSTPLWSLWSS
jgi:hypothetical protein